jgi:hypothetical protein
LKRRGKTGSQFKNPSFAIWWAAVRPQNMPNNESPHVPSDMAE